ncbi:MAG: NlpC/P60 family protein [Bacteroidetes bacterium]|nr:MAG: NlpC/P60 family protein [Bacteroidota bacterium]
MRRRTALGLLGVGLGVFVAACGRKAVPTAHKESSLRVVEVARRYLGTPYRWGGCDRRGFDCSGYVCRVFQEAVGLTLPRTADQQATVGKAVPLSDLRPGDLVFFREPGQPQITHVGIVSRIHQGQVYFLHASNSKGVTEDVLSQPYWQKRVVKARRIP